MELKFLSKRTRESVKRQKYYNWQPCLLFWPRRINHETIVLGRALKRFREGEWEYTSERQLARERLSTHNF